MKQDVFTDELIANMQKELNQDSSETLDLAHATKCLHSALEIFQEQGLQKSAAQISSLLNKISRKEPIFQKTSNVHSLHQLMQAGVSQRDLREFARGNPIATAKINLVLRQLGLSDLEIAKFLGPNKVLSEENARKMINPNEAGSLLEFKSLSPESKSLDEPEAELIEFESLALNKKHRKSPKADRHTKGLTPDKMVKNLLDHGHPLNLADDMQIPHPVNKNNLTKSDMEPSFEDLLNANTFDIDASDDELMNLEVQDDLLEISDIQDFEDEKD